MTRVIGTFVLGILISCTGCLSGVDKELMSMRQAVVANEQLYGAAAMKFADGADQMAGMKHTLQRDLLGERTVTWVKDHTKDGIVTATPAEINTMLVQRDAAYRQLGESESVWRTTVSDFRRLVADKMALSAAVYAREENAQRAKESLAAATDSLTKGLVGAASAAAVVVPLMLP